MNLHKNARTCPISRALIVNRVLDHHRPVVTVAEEFGISRKTVYKWIRRYRDEGVAGLQDASSEPQVIPHRLSQDWVDLVVELRAGYRMTAACIAQQLQLPRSTVSGVLQRAGISQLKQLDPPEPVRRYEHAAPGDMIHLDIKKLGRFTRPGHRVTGVRGKPPRAQGWEYVHVCIDDFSRVAYAEVLADQQGATAAAFLQRAVRWFRRFGIIVKRVLTDNGGCYKSGLWHVTCRMLAIKVKKTRPYRPQTNGKAERFIRTLKEEWVYARVYLSSDERQAVLPIYLTHYNEHRAHSSVNSKPPITRMPGVNNVDGIHN